MDFYPQCPDHTTDEMVYNQARLEHALRSFREAVPYYSQRGLTCANLGRHLQTKYDLRQSTKAIPPANISFWQDQTKKIGTDDDDYDPRQENRRVNIKRKRKEQQKRVLDDASNEDRRSKRSKVTDGRIPTQTNGAYTTFKFTSRKAKDILSSFGPSRSQHEVIDDGQRNGTEAESEFFCFNRYVSSRTKTEKKVQSQSELSKLADSLFDMEVDENTFGRNLNEQTSLRSGKILEKPVIDQVTPHHEHIVSVASYEHKPSTTPTQTGNLRCATETSLVKVTPRFITGERVENQIGMKDNPIEILDESEDDIKKPLTPVSIFHHNSFGSSYDNADSHINVKQELPPTPKSISTPFKERTSSNRSPFHSHHGITVINTSYAHPINFRSTVKDRCDFCADYRMGILGLGMFSVEVCVYPDRPNEYQEMGSGHRSHGKAPTVMCVQCALKRLMILRCHRPANSATTDEELYEPAPGNAALARSEFSVIQGLDHSPETLQRYNYQLFRRPNPSMHGLDREAVLSNIAPLPVCSLCVIPAEWECCTWQRTNILRNPCRVPTVELRTSSNTLTVSNSHSQSSSRTATPRYCTSKSTPCHRRKSRPIPDIITLSSSSSEVDAEEHLDNANDSDSDGPFYTVSKQARQAQQSLPATSHRSSFTIRKTPLSPSSRSSPPVVAATTSRLQPPIRGCGLKLCNSCKVFLDTHCNGFLDKKLVTRWLRGQISVKTVQGGVQKELTCKVIGRADVEFLFAGGLLERNYA